MSYASILSPYAFHYLLIYAFRFNSTYMISLIYSKWTLNLGKELMLQFIVTLLCLFLLCKPFYHLTYYIWTVRHFDALHSHPLIIPPLFYMFHILSCHYDTDISLIRLMIADSPYCGHSYDCNYVSLLCFTLSHLDDTLGI